MAYKQYRITLKSEEQRGASQPNICRLAFNSDADAGLFASNLALCFQADPQTIDTVLRSNYALPYPAGTNSQARLVMRDAAGHVQTERLYDLAPTTTVGAISAAIVAATCPLILPQYAGFGGNIVSVQAAIFTPGASY